MDFPINAISLTDVECWHCQDVIFAGEQHTVCECCESVMHNRCYEAHALGVRRAP